MKAIKINNIINLTSGLTISSGAIVIINSGYADISGLDADGKIPCQVSTKVYISLADKLVGKSNIPSNTIQDFNPDFNSLKLAVSSYETLPTEALLIGAVQAYLETIYPEKIEVINL